MSLSKRASILLGEKNLDEVESVWMTEMEADPSEVSEFLATARLMRKAGERTLSDTLLELLADLLLERKLWPQRLRVLREIGRLSRRPSTLREPLLEAVARTLEHKPSYRKVVDAVGISDPKANPVDLAEKIETWLRFDVGEPFFMSGRGVGVVIELNPELGLCRLDFENEKRVAVPLGAAPKYLEPIAPDHLLRKKFSDPEELSREIVTDPAGSFESLLRGFGRPMTAGEIKDALLGVVPSNRWSSWWNAARKHPQIVMTGAGARATYSWKSSTEAAEEAIRAKFRRAKLREKLEIARRQSGRGPELADEFASTLAAEAERLHTSDPAVAWEILVSLEKLPGSWQSELDPNELLLRGSPARTIASIPDRALREKALADIREVVDRWPSIYREVFFLEEDPRILTQIAEALESSGEDGEKQRLIEETLRFPRRHPHAFAWACREIADTDPLPERVDYPLVFQILEVIGSDEAAPVRARLKDLFDKGGLVIRIIAAREDAAHAQRLHETIDRHGWIESYRRDLIKDAVTMKVPSLREQQAEPILATAESATSRREEYEKLRGVEIPANLKAIQEAREMGDLRENFEYKAARQRQEYLSSRVAALQSELSRLRILDPGEIDASEVRVGTSMRLRNGDLEREVTILGPWESDPERGIYSHESDVAKALLGKRAGEVVSFLGNDYLIESIAPWK